MRPGTLSRFLAFLIFLVMGGVVPGQTWTAAAEDLQLVVLLEAELLASGSEALPGLESVLLLGQLLRDRDHFGLAVAGDRPEVVLPLAELAVNRRKLSLVSLGHLKGLKSGKFRWESLSPALDLFVPGGPKKRVLFLLAAGPGDAASPGGDPGAGLTRLQEQLRETGVVFSGGLFHGSPERAKAFRELALATGGRAVELTTPAEVYAAVLGIFELLRPVQQAPLLEGAFLVDDTVRTLTVAALRAKAQEPVTVSLPDGRQLAYPGRHPSCRWWARPHYDVITFRHPPAGRWILGNAQCQGTRVYLESSWGVIATGVPHLLGEDEVLEFRLGLEGPDPKASGPPPLRDLLFLAECLLPDGKRRTLRLEALGEGEAGRRVSSPEARFFPPHPPGDGVLKLYALAPDFQRLLVLPLTVTEPWYHWALSRGAGGGQEELILRPRKPMGWRTLQGQVTFSGSRGGISGILIQPVPGEDLRLHRPQGCDAGCQVSLWFRGTTTEGRTLTLVSSRPLDGVSHTPEPQPEAALPAAPKAPPRSRAAFFPLKASRPLLWVAFGLIISGLGGIVLLFFLQGRQLQEPEPSQAAEQGGKAPKLTLKAQVEALTREKQKLEQSLREAQDRISALLGEKQRLEEELARIRENSQLNIQNLEELRKKLEEAETEALNIRQEYMALYARSQKEKELLKKN